MKRLALGAACCITLLGCATSHPPASLPKPTQQGASELYTECVTALVVGLRWQPPAAGRVARYEITRNGAQLDTTRETYFADTTVAESTHYTYSVRTVLASGGTAAGPPQEVDTPAASPSGDAPYCRSRHIDSMNWDWVSGYNEPNGSDLWPVTWGKDGRVYTFFGDGGGFGGDDYRGRASFGIATMTGPPPPPRTSLRNVYGGYNSEHPSTLQGKAGSIIAVGSDFYTLGGVYNEAELAGTSGHRSGAPERVQLAYSKGNAYSWQAAAWTFCPGDTGSSRGLFCPGVFINYGPGNAWAPGGYVYVLGGVGDADSTGDGGSSYLARVPGKQVLEKEAYQYFSGLDARGQPLWSHDQRQMRPIFSDRNAPRAGCGGSCNMASPLDDVIYDRGIGRYIGIAQGDHIGQTSFYEALHPWGPWSTISYNNIEPSTGTGGWANLGIAGGDSLGVHVVNAWTSPDGLTLWMTYSSDGKAPSGSLFPPAGTKMDSFNLVSARLTPGPALR